MERNARPTGKYEIDLVMSKDGLLAFVEVKYRRGKEFGDGTEAIDGLKRHRIMAAAQDWMYVSKTPMPPAGVRFDVVTVVREDDGNMVVTHHEDAFGMLP